MYLLAEIADKAPGVFDMLGLSCVVAVLVVILGAGAWWLGGVLAAAALTWLNWVLISELCEPGWGSEIVRELGVGHVVGQFLAANTPIVAAALLIAPLRRFQRQLDRRERGQCSGCGYELASLPGIAACPECGSAR